MESVPRLRPDLTCSLLGDEALLLDAATGEVWRCSGPAAEAVRHLTDPDLPDLPWAHPGIAVLSDSGLLSPDAAAPIHTDRRRVLIGGAAALAAGLTAMALPSAVSAQSAAPEVVEQSVTTTESTTTTAETTTTTTSPPTIAPGDTISGTGTFTDETTKIEFIRATTQTTFNIAANWEWLSISWEAGTADGRSWSAGSAQVFKTGTAQDGTFTYTDGGSPATISPALVKQSNTVVVSFVPNAAFTATLKPNGGSSVTYTFLAV